MPPPARRSTRAWQAKRPAGSSARCNRPRAATTRASMRTPKAWKASSMSGTGTKSEALLSPEEYTAFAAHYGLDAAPNFEDKHWNLVVARDPEASPSAALAAARSKVFAAREKRVRPGRDEKILVSWNALMVRGMARAGRVFGNDEWIASARRSLDFIRATMWKNARLFATYKDGRAHLNAYLDDYAFLIDALDRIPAGAIRHRAARVRAGSRRCDARPVRGSRSRRFLLHGSRPREADPPAQARPRQRHAVGQRRGRLRAAKAGRAHRRGPLSPGSRARARSSSIRRCATTRPVSVR